jgi:predicted acetyltransferase
MARPEDFAAVRRMLELYQYELSDIWDQELDAHGEYGYDLTRHMEGQRFFAHVVLVDEHFAGFALVAPATVTQKEGFWMEQFFILKKYRHADVGTALARHVFQSHPGPWEVGQMHRNLAAQAFWRKVIASLTGDRFTEVQVTAGWWQGVVQRFNYEAAAS